MLSRRKFWFEVFLQKTSHVWQQPASRGSKNRNVLVYFCHSVHAIQRRSSSHGQCSLEDAVWHESQLFLFLLLCMNSHPCTLLLHISALDPTNLFYSITRLRGKRKTSFRPETFFFFWFEDVFSPVNWKYSKPQHSNSKPEHKWSQLWHFSHSQLHMRFRFMLSYPLPLTANKAAPRSLKSVPRLQGHQREPWSYTSVFTP